MHHQDLHTGNVLVVQCENPGIVYPIWNSVTREFILYRTESNLQVRVFDFDHASFASGLTYNPAMVSGGWLCDSVSQCALPKTPLTDITKFLMSLSKDDPNLFALLPSRTQSHVNTLLAATPSELFENDIAFKYRMTFLPKNPQLLDAMEQLHPALVLIEFIAEYTHLFTRISTSFELDRCVAKGYLICKAPETFRFTYGA